MSEEGFWVTEAVFQNCEIMLDQKLFKLQGPIKVCSMWSRPRRTAEGCSSNIQQDHILSLGFSVDAYLDEKNLT